VVGRVSFMQEQARIIPEFRHQTQPFDVRFVGFVFVAGCN
jgi:hypothetical protein